MTSKKRVHTSELTPESLSAWVKDSAAREHYLEAFRRNASLLQTKLPTATLSAKVQAPVLQIHWIQDAFLVPGGLNNT